MKSEYLHYNQVSHQIRVETSLFLYILLTLDTSQMNNKNQGPRNTILVISADKYQFLISYMIGLNA